MRKNTCETIRHELDEMMLDETCSTAAVEHLGGCAACREFYEKQTKLRQIVGSLGTVSAPADFDFRLRARLANESSSVVLHSSLIEWSFLRKSFAAAALLLVFATGAVLVRTVVNHRIESDELAKQKAAAPISVTPTPTETVTPKGPETPEVVRQNDVPLAPNKQRQRNDFERTAQVAVRNVRPLATVDSSSVGANVINGAEPAGASAAFPIDASLQSFKVSLDDGRGNAKTISVPTISFGSQRLMQNANQFAPKRVW